MNSRKPSSPGKTSPLPSSYAPLLADLKARVRTAQVKAALSVNRELILLYWHIGREILRAQKAEGWGTKVVQRLAKDLTLEFLEMRGFSYTNLMRMRVFAEAYGADAILPQLVGELGAVASDGRILPQLVGESTAPIIQPAAGQLAGPIVPQAVAKSPLTKRGHAKPQIVAQAVRQFQDEPPEPLALLPWGTNILLIEKVKDPAARLWYARKTLEHGWSRAVLTVQIETKLHERSGKAVNNFAQTLPPAQSDMAREVLKDPYTFDFLSLSEEAHERELERGLVEHIRQFLLELGAGFAFVGQQVQLEVGDEDFYLDLLFYHLQLRCFVVVDLKMKPFEPEFAGKLNFYLSAVDDKMRHADDAPTIGLLLCKDAKNKLKIEYALRDVKKPMGVAQWQTRLVESLPKKLSGSLPTIAELEKELQRTKL